jgi:hypothetical protein
VPPLLGKEKNPQLIIKVVFKRGVYPKFVIPPVDNEDIILFCAILVPIFIVEAETDET